MEVAGALTDECQPVAASAVPPNDRRAIGREDFQAREERLEMLDLSSSLTVASRESRIATGQWSVVNRLQRTSARVGSELRWVASDVDPLNLVARHVDIMQYNATSIYLQLFCAGASGCLFLDHQVKLPRLELRVLCTVPGLPQTHRAHLFPDIFGTSRCISQEVFRRLSAYRFRYASIFIHCCLLSHDVVAMARLRMHLPGHPSQICSTTADFIERHLTKG